jgi:threonine/homoserine/homoserine lactone efflux protein
MSTPHSEPAERFGGPFGCPPTASDEAYRRLLRAFLTSQVGFERAQNLRQTLLFALTATSFALWLLAAWPELLPVSVRSMSLGVWLLLFTALLYTWVVELLWLRRSNDARRHLRAIALPPAAKLRATEGNS